MATERRRGGLIRVEPDATVIAEAYRKRAIGASWTGIAEFLKENDVRSSKGSPAWSLSGVASLLRNRAYLGEARSGSVVNADAHEPIVTQAEFDVAQSTSTLYKQHDGRVASKSLLGGLARCAGCGYTLIDRRDKDSRGESFPVYYCKGRSAAKGRCPDRASIRASYLDCYVEEHVLAALEDEDGLIAQAVLASQQITEAQRDVEAAEHELMLYLETDLVSTIGVTAFRQDVKAGQHMLDEARERSRVVALGLSSPRTS